MRTALLILGCTTLLTTTQARAAVDPVVTREVKACNSKSAKIDDAAELPTEFDDAPFGTPSASPLVGAAGLAPAADAQVPRLDLSHDLASLSPLSGAAIGDAPVLLLRLENLPSRSTRRAASSGSFRATSAVVPAMRG